MRSVFLIVTFFSFGLHGFGQDDGQGVRLQFEPIFQNEKLVLTEESTCDTFPCISVFKAYLSHFQLVHDDEVVWEEADSFHLIDASAPNSLDLRLEVPKEVSYDHIRFYLGIDSLTSVSGAFGGDLDPTKGMYWTWNSGYIHFKLEGRLGEVLNEDNAFEFHLGEYQGPYAVFEKVELPFPDTSQTAVQIDLDAWLGTIDLERTYKIMSPCSEANELATQIPQIFLVHARK